MSPTPNIQSNVVYAGDETFITVFVSGDLRTIGQDHPNFKTVVGLCAEEVAEPGSVDPQDVADLLDPAETVVRKFDRLTERVTVENGQVCFDGDPVDGSLQTQILDFLEAGEDFGPLVHFYEKLETNPLGDVREGLFDYIRGQHAGGASFSITPDGDVIGYKSMQSQAPEWREGVGDTVFVPSRPSSRGDRVNDEEVPNGKYIEQVPGDTVAMPRSTVLHAPSQACGDGLHVGTFAYAETFSGDTVMLVRFSPRDIVSVPDSNSTWKLRVCRYDVLGECDSPLDAPLYITEESAGDVVDDAEDIGVDLVF
jgi:hypothetical protein